MRPVLAVLLASSVVLGLAGCAPDDHTLSPTSTPFPTGIEGEGSLPPEPVNETVGINCSALLSAQTIYDWGNGNFALDASFVPESGSRAAQSAADGGLACRWINLTSQETLDAAVSIPTAADLATAQQSAAAGGIAVPEFGDAYFRSADGIGYLDVFIDGRWLTLQSTWFYEASDATLLVDAATTALPPRS
jgi:hypothetical protein